MKKKSYSKQFEREKKGDHGISGGFRERLERDLDDFQGRLMGTIDAYNECLNQYTNFIGKALENGTFFDENKFLDVHKEAKTKSVSQV